MAEMTDAQFKQKVIDVLDEVGANVASSQDIDQVDQITDNITLPGVELDNQGGVVRYVSAKMAIFKNYLDAVKDVFYNWFGHDDTEGVQKTWKEWFSDTLATGVRKMWNTWFGTAPTEQSAGSGVQGEWAGLKTDAQTQTQAARTAAAAATAAAESVQDAIDTATAAAQTANTAAQNADTSRQQIEANESTRQSNEVTRQSNESTRQSQETARETRAGQDHSRAETDHNTASGDHTTASTDHSTATNDHSRAENDHTASVAATTAATNVNADLTGMTVTITNRQGVSKSVNIGFEILEEHVYPSVAAMNADAANVRAGEFCMIATTDPTSADNAQLWSRNSSAATSAHPFTFLSDLDQASSAAWADWLNNYKPTIEADHTRAESDHATATSDHSTANTDHNTAVDDHTRAGQDHSRAETDHTTASGDHTIAGTDHSRAETDHTTASGDHTQAGQDHTRAETDHSTATDDHATAGTDHTRAESDHNTASGDHTQAGQDHTRAETDHSTASDDHSTAGTDHNRAENDHTESAAATAYAKEQGDYAKDWTDHPPYIGDGTTGDLNYWYLYNIQTKQYVKGPYAKGDNLEWDDITPAEKQILINEMLQTLEDEGFDAVPTEGSSKPVRSGGIYTALQTKQDNLTFASVATCEAIVDELV